LRSLPGGPEMKAPALNAIKSAAHPSVRPLRFAHLQRYGLAALSVGSALAAGLLLEHFHFRVPSALLLLFAVALSSWYGGRGPAVLAAVLSIITFYWYFVQPVRTIYIDPSEIPYFITFVSFVALLSWFGTVRRRAEKALREQANLLNLTHDTVFVMDMEGAIQYWNRGAEGRYGWTAEEAVGKAVHDLLKTAYPVPQEQIKAELIRTGRWEGELVHARRDGTPVIVASRWALQRDPRGTPVAILETNNDITERKRGEEALRRLNRELRAISNCNQVLLRANDEQSLLERICRIVCEEAGYSLAWVGYAVDDEAKSVRPVAWTGAEEGYLASARITWADTDRGRGHTGTAIRCGESCCIQDFAADPRVAPWREDLLQRSFRSGIALPLRDEHNDAFGSLTIHSAQPNAFTPEEIRLLEELAADLAFGILTLRSRTARKHAEQEVALLSFALDNVREAALLIDDAARFHYVNNEGCRVLGYTRAELLGMSVPDIDPEFPAGRWSDHWRDLKAQRSLNFESRHRTGDGRIFPVEISANYFEYGGRAYNLALVRDVTQRKRAEEALRLSNAYNRSLIEASLDPLVTIGPDGRITDINAATETATGGSRRELIGTDFCDYFTEPAKARTGYEQVFREGTVRDYPLELRHLDGHVMSVLYNASVYRDESGQVIGVFAAARDITERKRAEQALRQREAYLAESQRLSHTGTWVLNAATGNYVYASEEALRVFGFDPQKGPPTRDQLYERIHPEDRAGAKQASERMYREKVEADYGYRLALPDGTIKHIHAIGHPVLDENGQVTEYLGTIADITDRKRAEEALRLSNAYNRSLIETSLDPLVTIGPDGKVTDVNAATEAATGRSRSELIGTDFCDYFTEPAQARTGYEQAFREGLVRDYPLELRHRDGRVMSVLYNASVYRDESDQVSGVFAAARDITERKRIEEALRRTAAYLADAQRLTHTGAWAGDRTTAPLYWSEEVFRIFGFDPQQGLPTRDQPLERIHPKDLDKFLQGFHRTINEKVDSEDEYRVVLPDGTLKHIHAVAHPVVDPDGELVEVVGTVVDITERKRAEEALRESEMRFRTFVDHAVEAFFMLDFEEGTIIDVNRCACESLGYTREELIGMNPMSFDVDLDRATVESMAERAAAGETVLFDRHWHRRKDGTLFPVEVQTSVFWHGGRRFLLKIARDTSDRLRAEQQRDRLRQLEADLAHTNRVSMMGELAASVAHEVNQPLSGVVSNASAGLRWLAGDVPNLEEAREGLRRIVRDGKRAGEVIARIRALTRKAATPKEKVDLNETIREVLALVGDEAKRKSVIIRTQFADDLSPVAGDRVQLQQVVLNLVMNAIEAMSVVDERARALAITTRNIDPDQVQVTAQDSGPGIDPQTIDRIFDSFYTTKPGGMGMGLSISRSILQAHGGRIWATANHGPGTIFHFTLPKYHLEEINAEVASV